MTETNDMNEITAEMDMADPDAAEDGATAEELLEDLITVNEGRAAQYGMLARLFRREVDADLLAELHGLHYKVSTGNEHMDKGHLLFATALSGLWQNSETELAADYLRTLFGHGYSGHSGAYPYESVYADEHRLMMRDARDEVLALYRAAGLEKDTGWKDGEDHIAVELEFMAVLAKRASEALRAGDEDAAYQLTLEQRNFLADHLNAWAPVLAEAMREYTKTKFYEGLSYMLQGFLETDEEVLADLLAA